MKYIIMCGGSAFAKDPPIPLTEICGETVVARTIRLLRENGVEDIAISGPTQYYQHLEVPVLEHDNPSCGKPGYHWLNAFYPMSTPVCYIYGDVFYSPTAIKTIVECETDDIEYFASAYPLSLLYIKKGREPFAFKVVNTKRFFECVERTKRYDKEHCLKRSAISWELWQVIRATPLNIINQDYTVINDYTVDIDSHTEEAVRKLECIMKTVNKLEEIIMGGD